MHLQLRGRARLARAPSGAGTARLAPVIGLDAGPQAGTARGRVLSCLALPCLARSLPGLLKCFFESIGRGLKDTFKKTPLTEIEFPPSSFFSQWPVPLSGTFRTGRRTFLWALYRWIQKMHFCCRVSHSQALSRGTGILVYCLARSCGESLGGWPSGITREGGQSLATNTGREGDRSSFQ